MAKILKAPRPTKEQKANPIAGLQGMKGVNTGLAGLTPEQLQAIQIANAMLLQNKYLNLGTTGGHSSFTEAIGTEDTPSATFGDSQYDGSITYNSDPAIINEQRYNAQGYLDIFGNSLAKAAGSFTTASLATVGLISNLFSQWAYNDADSVGEYISQAATEGVNKYVWNLDDWVRNNTEIYRSAEQKANDWHDAVNIFSGNTVGMLADLLGFATSAAMTGGLAGSGFAALGMSARGAGLAGSLVASLGEASIEAGHTKKEYLDAKTRELYSMAENEYAKIASSEMYTPEQKQEALKQLELKIADTLEGIEQQSKALGTATFLLNTAVLSTGNFIHFGKYIGIKRAIKEEQSELLASYAKKVAAGEWTKEQYKQAVKRLNKQAAAKAAAMQDAPNFTLKGALGEEGAEYINKESKRHYLNFFKDTLVEGFEEMNQRVISEAEKKYSDQELNYIVKNKYKGATEADNPNFFASLIESAIDTYTDEEAWQEFALGFIGGGIGTPTITRNSEGKFRPKWVGNAFQAINESKQKFADTQAIVDELNEYIKSDKFQEGVRDFRRLEVIRREKENAIIEGDLSKLEELEHKEFMLSAVTLAKHGRLGDLKELYGKKITEEEAKAIIDKTTQQTKDGKLEGLFVDPNTPTKTKSPAEVAAEINEINQEKLEQINQLSDLFSVLTAEFKDSLSKEEIADVAAAQMVTMKMLDNARNAATQFVEDLYSYRGVGDASVGEKSPLHRELSGVRDSLRLKAEKIQDEARKERYTKEADKIQEFLDIMDELGKAKEANEDSDVILEKLLKRNEEKVKKAKEAQEKLDKDKDSLSEEEVLDLEEAASYFTDLAEGYNGALKILGNYTHDAATLDAIRTASKQIAKSYSDVINSFIKYRGAARTFEVLRIKGHANSISQEAQAEEEGKSKEKKRKSKVEEYLASEEYNKLLAIGDHQAIKDKLNSLGATAAEKKRVELEFNKSENQKKHQFRTKALNFIRIWRDSYKDNPNSSLFQLMEAALKEENINGLIISNRESVILNFLNSFNDNTNVTSFLSSLLKDEWDKLDAGMQKELIDTATEIISKMNSLGSSANGKTSTDATAIEALYKYALDVLNGEEPVEDVDKDEFKKALDVLAALASPEITLKEYIKQYLDNVNDLEKYKNPIADGDFITLVDSLEKIHKKLISKQAPTKPTQTPQDEKDKIITEIEDILTKNGIDKTSIQGLDKVDLGTLKNFKQLIEKTDFKSLKVKLSTGTNNGANGAIFLQLNIYHGNPLILDAHNGKKISYRCEHTIIIDAQGSTLKRVEYGLEDLMGLESSLQSEQGDKEKLKWLEDNGFITQKEREDIEKKLDEGNKLDSINFLNLEEPANLKITSIEDADSNHLQSIKDSGTPLVDIRYSNSGPSNTNNSNNASTSNVNVFTNSTKKQASTTITEFIEKQDGTFKLTEEGNEATSAVELIKLTGGFTAVSTGQIPKDTELKIYKSIPKGFPNIDKDDVLKHYVGKDIKNHKGQKVAVLAYVDTNGNLVVIDIVSEYILSGIKQLLKDEHEAAWDADGHLLNATVKIDSFGNSSIPFHNAEYPDLSTRNDSTISMEEAINLEYVVPAFIDGSGEIVRIDGKGTVPASEVIYNDKISLDEGKIIFLYKQADGLYYPAIGTVKRLTTGDSSRGVYIGVGDTSNSIVSNVRSNLIQIVANAKDELAAGDKLKEFKESLLGILEETFYITSDLSIEILHSESFKAKNGKPRTTISISTPHSNVSTKSGFNRKYITITDENGNLRSEADIVSELMNAFGELNLPFNVGKGLTAGDVTQRTSVNTVYNRAINGRLYYKPLAVSYDGTSYTIVTNENPEQQSNGTSTGISSNSSKREEEITVVAPDNSEATIKLTLQGNRLLNSEAFLRANVTDIDNNLTVEEEKLGNSPRRALVLAYLLLNGTPPNGVTKEEAEAIIEGFSEGNATLDYTGPKDFHITFSDSTSSAHIMVSDGKIHIVRNRTNTKSIVAKESDTPIEGAVDISSDMFDNLKSAEDTDVTTTDTTYQIKEEGSNTAVEYQRVTSLTPLKYSENGDYAVLREMGNLIESFVIEEIKKHFNDNVPLENLHPIVRDLLSRLEGYKFVQDKKLLYGNIKVEGNDTNVAGVPDLIFYNEDTKKVVIIDVKTSFQNYIPGYNVMYNSDNFDKAYKDNNLSKADSYRAQLLRYRQLLVNNLGLKEGQVSLYVLPIKWNTISGHTSNNTVGNHYRNIDTNKINTNDLKLEINTVHYALKGVGFNMSNEREGAGLLPIGYNVDNGSKFIPGDTTGIERSPEESSTGINNAEESISNIKDAFEFRSSEVFRQLPTTPTIDIKRELAWLASKLPNVNKQMAIAIYDRVFRIASSGIEVYGMYKNGVIYLAENGPAGTLYHEAFHAVYRTLLTEEERLEVYREMKELYPDKTPIQIEEMLAEKFAEYTMGLTYDDSIKGRIVKFFRMIKEMLKNFLRINSEMDRMFYNIHSGKYGNREVSISTDVANNTIYDLRGLEFSSGIAPTIVNINGKPVKVLLEGSKNTKINPMEEMKNNRATVHASSISIATISSEDQFNSFRNTHNGVYHNGKVTIYRESARAVKLTSNSLAGSIELLNDSIDSSNVTAKTLNKLGITKATFNELPIEIQENILFCN